MEGHVLFSRCGGEVGLEVPYQLSFRAYGSVPNSWGEPLVFIAGPEEVDEVWFTDLFHAVFSNY